MNALGSFGQEGGKPFFDEFCVFDQIGKRLVGIVIRARQLIKTLESELARGSLLPLLVESFNRAELLTHRFGKRLLGIIGCIKARRLIHQLVAPWFISRRRNGNRILGDILPHVKPNIPPLGIDD